MTVEPPSTPASEATSAPIGAAPPHPPTTTHRLLSLDAFRGLVIVMMFLVNVAGADPAFPEWFEHRGYNAGRHGNGLADFVFPWFLFIVGCAIPFSMASGRGAGQPAWRKVLAALRRGTTIYLLGTLVWCASSAYKPDEPGRLHHAIDATVFLHWDILPLIGFGYAVGVCLWLLPRPVRVAFVAGVLVFKWLSLTQLTHPDLGRVVWTDHDSMDRWIRANYGWFGTLLTQGLPAASLVVLGSFLGNALRPTDATTPFGRASAVFAAGALATVASYALHRWNLPYSKDFLTSSYVLVMAGSAAMTLALVYWLVDIRRATTLQALRVFGVNALFAYIFAELTWKMALTRWFAVTPGGGSAWLITAWKAWMQRPLGPTAGSWAHVASYILVYWLFCRALYRRKIYVKV